MPSASLRLAVIGAGAAGLAAARELRREGHAPVVFERAAAVGGTWLYAAPAAPSDPLGAAATHSSLYASLRTNLPRETMGFLDFPFAAEAPGSADHRRFPGARGGAPVPGGVRAAVRSAPARPVRDGGAQGAEAGPRGMGGDV